MIGNLHCRMRIDANLFTGTGGLCDSDVTKGEVNNYSNEVDTALSKFGWKGDAVASIILALNGNNTEVLESHLAIRGKPREREYRIDAKKVWPEADEGVTLVVSAENLRSFKFTAGGMCSDYLDGSTAVHQFYSGDSRPKVLLAGDLLENEIGEFCLRVVCQLSKESTAERGLWLAYTLLIFPGTAAELAAKGQVTSYPNWPGIKIAEGEMQFLPRPSKTWGCPIVPLLLPGTPLSQEPTIPAAAALKTAIAGVMNSAVAPDSCKNVGSLQNKWAKLERQQTLPAKEPAVTWPAEDRTADEGRDYHYLT